MIDYANSKCRITGKICYAWSEVAGCGLVRCKFTDKKSGDEEMTDSRKDCPIRHENGNCTVAGGFCTAVHDPICEALHNAFDCGYRSALRKQDQMRNEPLTLDELLSMAGEPVWVQSPGIPEYGRWGIVCGVDMECGERTLYLQADFTCRDYGKNWLAYRQKPEEVQK